MDDQIKLEPQMLKIKNPNLVDVDGVTVDLMTPEGWGAFFRNQVGDGMDSIEDSQKSTQHTLVGLGVDYDESVPKGRIAIHPETFNDLWINTKVPITLNGGNPISPDSDCATFHGIGTRPSMWETE